MEEEANEMNAVMLKENISDQHTKEVGNNNYNNRSGVDGEIISKGPPWYRSQRYILAYILFVGIMNPFFQRVNFSIAVVCMVNHTATTITIPTTNTTTATTSPVSNTSTMLDDSCSSRNLTKQELEDGPFLWDKPLQGLLLGSIYWTYLVFSVPSIHVARRFTIRRVLIISMSAMSLMTMLSHGAALWSPWAVFVIRLGQGACTPLTLVSIYGMWAHWAPPSEQTGLVAICFSGGLLASGLTFPVAGLLCKYGGWPSIFYFFGVAGFVWIIVFVLFTYETPAQHPRITAEERYYIETSLPQHSTSGASRKPDSRWLSIATSGAVWGMTISNFAFAWGLLLLLSTLPQYMKEVLHFQIDSNGLFLMAPYTAMWLCATLSAKAADRLIQRKVLPLLWVRRLFLFIGNVPSAVLMCLLGFLDCDQAHLAMVLLTIIVGLTGSNFSCFLVNPIDIAPQYAREILSFTSSMSTVPGIVTPYIVAILTAGKTREEWQVVFFLTAGVYLMGTVGFLLLGKADVQKWALPSKGEHVLVKSADEKEIVIMSNNDVKKN